MTDFVFETTPKLVCEAGAAARLGEMAKALGIRRALIVTDAGLVAAGLLEPVQAGFAAAGSACVLFSDVLADPPEASVALAVQAARDAEADGVIGFGGGGVRWTPRSWSPCWPARRRTCRTSTASALPRGPRLPLIQVPTTAGTGSEVTPIAIVTTPTSEKKGVVSSLLYPDLAVLDARLTLGLPPRVTAMTGIDAMVHAIEAYTTRHKKNPLSDSLALRALSLLGANIRTVIEDGRNVAARAAMLQGSLLAGIAFANAPVGAVHALAYPLGGHFHVPHGLSNALVLLPVLEFNRPAAETLYAELAPAILPGRSFATPAEAAVGFIGAMRDLVAAMPMEQRLEEVGVRREDLPMLAADAMKVQRLLINNPREVSYDDALAIYGQAY
ncbi:iron-containing alcohol dehydrogenase [Azospirillum doebereinerae]|uniref:iron-containing alcohol dehydrogenase n=1 Tax=Azospirillum doebereinerae TaxID=92933 RepID=UPI0038507E9B